MKQSECTKIKQSHFDRKLQKYPNLQYILVAHKFNFLPLESSNSNYFPWHMMPNLPTKFHYIKWINLRKGALKMFKTQNLDFLPLESSDNNYIPSCKSTYDAQLSYKFS